MLNHTTIAIIVFLFILGTQGYVFGQTTEDMINTLNHHHTRNTILTINGSILIVNQTVTSEFMAWGPIAVHPELINIGNKNITICYLWQPFFTVVDYKNGSTAWANGPGIPPMEFSYTDTQTLGPGVPFTPKSPYQVDPPLVLDKGNYTVSSIADIYVTDDNGKSLSPRILLWSKPLQITVSPEHYVQINTDQPIYPPLKQLKSRIAINDIQCKSGFTLLAKTSDNSPACVKPDTAQKLAQHGWAA